MSVVALWKKENYSKKVIVSRDIHKTNAWHASAHIAAPALFCVDVCVLVRSIVYQRYCLFKT